MTEKTLPASRFSWNDRRGVAFASDLELGVGEMPKSLTLENTKRGTKKDFEFGGFFSNAEGETTHWGYRSRCGITLTIFNT